VEAITLRVAAASTSADEHFDDDPTPQAFWDRAERAIVTTTAIATTL
jgi:hypothetical protein